MFVFTFFTCINEIIDLDFSCFISIGAGLPLLTMPFALFYIGHSCHHRNTALALPYYGAAHHLSKLVMYIKQSDAFQKNV